MKSTEAFLHWLHAGGIKVVVWDMGKTRDTIPKSIKKHFFFPLFTIDSLCYHLQYQFTVIYA